MLYFENWKITDLRGMRARCAAVVAEPLQPGLSRTLPSWLPHKQVALGLDLRGGSYLLLEVDVAAAQHERLNSLIEMFAMRCATPISAIPGSTSKAMRSSSRY